MTDTSERIIILTAIILMFVAIQSYSMLTGKRIGTLNDIEVEIYTPQVNYTLGEGFTATIYFVNSDIKDVWIKAFHQYTINRYNLNHPEKGIISDVLVNLDQENPWIHVPAHSRMVFDTVFCKPQYEGEFRICCLGAEKTVLILEQDSAWVTATVINVELSPEHKKMEISSDNNNVPRTLYKAIDKALEEKFKEGEVTSDGSQRTLHISTIEAETLIHYFEGEIERDRLNYEFYVGYVDYTFSILIQFSLPIITS